MSLMASLPWYDLPQRQPQQDHFWSVLKRQLHDHGVGLLSQTPFTRHSLPDRLNRHTPLEQQWANPKLLLSQCCGPDLFTPRAQGLTTIARPVFSDLDCAEGDYFSHIVVSDALGEPCPGAYRFVINSASSRSGSAALFEWTQRHQLSCQSVLVSGAHACSLDLLRSGLADIAAIDAHSWPLLDTRGVTIIGRSQPAASPPFVMHRDCPVSRDIMRAALGEAISQVGDSLHLSGLMPADHALYQSVPAPWQAAMPADGGCSSAQAHDNPPASQ
ncbi:hypothetical protein [Oceanisphaera sp.]|uniref:hypothetical protein n=1 Tax=Oceanisphaera sp. TaxID=1929979 RepID=UPI003A8DE39E